jgi:hypothetical protein
MGMGLMGGMGLAVLGDDAGFVEEIDDFGGEALELVIEVMGKEIDALVGAFDAAAHEREIFRLLMAQLVEFRAELLEEFLQLLLERGAALEVIDDFEEDEEDGAEGRRIHQPGGEMRRIGRGDFLGEDPKTKMRV